MLNHTEIEQLADIISKRILEAQPLRRWLTLSEAMRYAKVKSRDTIRRWIDEGYIYAHKRTGQWIVDRESIDDWFGSQKD